MASTVSRWESTNEDYTFEGLVNAIKRRVGELGDRRDMQPFLSRGSPYFIKVKIKKEGKRGCLTNVAPGYWTDARGMNIPKTVCTLLSKRKYGEHDEEGDGRRMKTLALNVGRQSSGSMREVLLFLPPPRWPLMPAIKFTVSW